VEKLVESTEKKEELQESLTALSKIYRGIIHIQRQQLRDRYRLALHNTANQHNYSHVFYGSLLETIIFIVVAAFQVKQLLFYVIFTSKFRFSLSLCRFIL
jgi:hypothetical protein